MNYKVYISKEDEVLMEIFYKYFNQLSSFKNRHYAIAKWIVRDIRARGYTFKAYSNNNMHMRPVKFPNVIRKTNREIYEEQIMDNLHRKETEIEVSDFERLIH